MKMNHQIQTNTLWVHQRSGVFCRVRLVQDDLICIQVFNGKRWQTCPFVWSKDDFLRRFSTDLNKRYRLKAPQLDNLPQPNMPHGRQRHPILCVFAEHPRRQDICDQGAEVFFRGATMIWPFCRFCAERHKRVTRTLHERGMKAPRNTTFDIPLTDRVILTEFLQQGTQPLQAIIAKVDALTHQVPQDGIEPPTREFSIRCSTN